MRLTTVPEYVMRTGTVAVFDPRTARAGATQKYIEDTVRTPIGRQPGRVPTGGGATDPPLSGTLMGADADGRPIRVFEAEGAPSSAQASRAVSAIKSVAAHIRARGLTSAITPLVAGPLAALANGEAIVLRFTNGVAISAAL
jgi:hypothetical protein